MALQCQRWTKRTPYGGNKPFKSKVKEVEDDVFAMGPVKNATQFWRSLLDIADYVQVKYNNEVGDAIRNLKHPVFIFPEMPEERFKLDKDGNQIYQRQNKMKVFTWKKQWE